MSDRFDRVEIRAVNTIGEAEWYWKRQPRIIAARLDLPPTGIMERVRQLLDRVLMREAL